MRRLLVLAFAAFLITPTHAEEWDWDIGYKRPGFTHHHHRARLRAVEHRVRLYREAGLEADRRAERREERHDEHAALEDERGVRCLEPVRGVGTEWIGQEGALTAARKDWMERVRYDHGERFLDMTNDRDEVSRCSPVSIGELVGKVMYRCEIWARPCQAHMEQAHMDETPPSHKEEAPPPEAQK